MKVEMFHDTDYTQKSISRMQDEVNEFMSDKNVLDIKIMSEGAENGHSYTIMVIYKEDGQ